MSFGQLPKAARAYLLAVYALAAAIVAAEWWYASTHPDLVSQWPWWGFAILAAGAAVAHSFPVSTPERQAFHVSPPFFVAGVILLSPLQMVALILVMNAAEWVRRRRSWFGFLFNVSAYIAAAAASQTAYFAIWPRATGPLIALNSPVCMAAGLAAVLTFLVVNHAFVSGVLWFANGIPARQHLDGETLVMEALLLAMGLPGVQLALIAPWAWLLGAAPLLLIHRALDVPNMRAQRRQDAMTQLFNAPYLIEACSRELHRVDRFGRSLAMIVLDIDRLGTINANYGRQAGDAAIQGTARLLARAIRGYDVAARVIGGEFAVLLPETYVEHAESIAERMRCAAASHRIDVATSLEPIQLTVSIGVAVSRGGGETPDQIFAAAEAAMGRAKRQGGNVTCLARLGTEAQVTLLPQRADDPDPLSSEPAAAAVRAAAPGEPTAAEPAPAASSAHHASPPMGHLDHDGDTASRGDRAAVAASAPRRWPSWLPSLPAQSDRRGLMLSLAAAAAALVTISGVALHTPAADPLTVVLLIGLVLMVDLRSFELYAGSTNSISVVPMIAAGMLLGPTGAVLVAPVSAVVRGIHRRSRWYKVVFNASLYIVGAAAAAAVFDVLAPPLAPGNLIQLLLAATLAGMTYYLLNTFSVAIAVATDLRLSPLRVWGDQFRWLWLHYLVLSGMALLLALAYHEFGIAGAAAFVVPPLMMHYVSKQYMDKTLANVKQLRTLNEQLETEIAQRKAAEADNARLAEEAARAAALEELSRLKSEFISVASHELRTPMTAILGFSELLLEDTPVGDPQRETLAIVHEEAVQLSSLVDNLLDVSRIENGRLTADPTAIDLSDTVLPPLVHALGTSAPDHKLVVDIAPDAHWVEADAAKLNQILTNLISNAIKYSPAGGSIAIRARRDEAPGRVVISVSDEGIGIPPEQLDRIFDRFYRVDSSETRSIGGTGLGLYIARHLAELHGGTMYADSEIGKGSTFYFTLPSAAPEMDQWDLPGENASDTDGAAGSDRAAGEEAEQRVPQPRPVLTA